MRLQLIPVEADGSSGPAKNVRRRKFVIGRAKQSDLQLSHPLVSRKHCVLMLRRTGAAVRDAGSRHGTYLNGEPLQGTRTLHDGDTLTLPLNTFEVRFVRDGREGWWSAVAENWRRLRTWMAGGPRSAATA